MSTNSLIISNMEDRQQIFSLYFDKSTFINGPVDITAELFKQIDKEKIESIKYVMHTATQDGIYYTVVAMKKKEDVQKGKVGFLNN
ncbi:MAG: hypothetical protein MRZ79_11505 [Bacteroidia bacterium]|nr:hypothetical protein [Bacteroidia bacterium]